MTWGLVHALLGSYDPVFSSLAAFVCAVGSVTSVELFCRAAKNKHRARVAWICIGAIAGGFGIWAANFVAMLAFSPTAANHLNLWLTSASLLVAVGFTGTGFAVATMARLQDSAYIGGAITGAGIAAMQFVGLAGLSVGDNAHWSPLLMAVSILLAPVFGALALSVCRYGDVTHQLLGSLLLFLAICSHHLIATAAVTTGSSIVAAHANAAISRTLISVGIAGAGILILLMACTLLAVDYRDRRHAARENERFKTSQTSLSKVF